MAVPGYPPPGYPTQGYAMPYGGYGQHPGYSTAPMVIDLPIHTTIQGVSWQIIIFPNSLLESAFIYDIFNDFMKASNFYRVSRVQNLI